MEVEVAVVSPGECDGTTSLGLRVNSAHPGDRGPDAKAIRSQSIKAAAPQAKAASCRSTPKSHPHDRPGWLVLGPLRPVALPPAIPIARALGSRAFPPA